MIRFLFAVAIGLAAGFILMRVSRHRHTPEPAAEAAAAEQQEAL